MSLIKARANRVRILRHICRLQEPNRDTLVLYARFIGDTADYVVNQLIETTLAKDRDFVNKHTASVNFGGWGAWGPGATQVPRQQHRGEDVAHARCVR